MDRRTFLVGLGSLAAGSGAILEAGAVTTVDADRSADVQTAGDPNALLGLDGVDDAGTTPTFTNNGDGRMVVTLSSSAPGARFDVGETGSFERQSATFGLGPTATRRVAIDGDGGTVPVSVDATVEDGDGAVVGSISLQRRYAVQTAYEVPPGQRENGDVETESDVVVRRNGQVNGSVESGGDVTVGRNGQINGSVEADGAVTLGRNAQVNSSVETTGDVTVGRNGQVNGSVETDGGVTVEQNGQINSDVEAGGAVRVGHNGQINGSVETTGDVTLERNGQINGTVETDGTVSLGCNARVNGTIDAADTVDTC